MQALVLGGFLGLVLIIVEFRFQLLLEFLQREG